MTIDETLERGARTDAAAVPAPPATLGATTGAETGAGIGPARARRAAADLPFTFADRDLAIGYARDADEPSWLLAERRESADRFESLPVEANPLFTPYVDFRGADLAEVTPYRPVPATDVHRDGLPPDGISALVEIREDAPATIVISDAARAAGLAVESFASLLGRQPDALRVLLTDAPVLPEDDKLAQLTRAFWGRGLAIHVPAGVRLTDPIVVRWASGRPGTALLTRTVVSLGPGAEAGLLEELLDSGGSAPESPQSLFTGTLEVSAGPGSRLDVASIQELGERSVAFLHRSARIEEDARVRWALGHIGGALVRSRVDNRLVGDRGSVEQVEIGFGGGGQHFDLTSYTRHLGRDTTSDLLSKGVFQDRARGYIKGLIEIHRSAVGTDSFLGEFGMLLARKARSVTIPSLEIDQPDVRRASHSSSVAPIDESQVFYLMSRGVPREIARKFIVLGFLEPVVARIPLADAQQRLRELLDAKWAEGRADPQAA